VSGRRKWKQDEKRRFAERQTDDWTIVRVKMEGGAPSPPVAHRRFFRCFVCISNTAARERCPPFFKASRGARITGFFVLPNALAGQKITASRRRLSARVIFSK
jgi:hypothetical protein